MSFNELHRYVMPSDAILGHLCEIAPSHNIRSLEGKRSWDEIHTTL